MLANNAIRRDRIEIDLDQPNRLFPTSSFSLSDMPLVPREKQLTANPSFKDSAFALCSTRIQGYDIFLSARGKRGNFVAN